MTSSFKPNDNFFWYLYFMCERQNIFWKRLRGESWPYTDDEILQNNKFCNVYRELDRVSQYLISNVIYNEKSINGEYSLEDVFYRILLFKHFNNINTWETLKNEFGDINFNVKLSDIEKVLTEEINSGTQIYSNAFMTTAFTKGSKYPQFVGVNKHIGYFELFRKEIFDNEFFYQILLSESMEELFFKFKEITNFGNFQSMQFSIDFNYSELFNFDESEFIVAGPGAERGILRTFDIEGKPDFQEIIKFVYNNLEQLLKDYSIKFDMPLRFEPLPGRMPTLISLQNCFCESDKYMRVSGIETEGVKVSGTRMKSQYSQQSTSKPAIKYTFPPKWNVGKLN